jgi:Ran GTPase-activating protein (RanGAP) involved in mRNA processing and transport
MRGAIKSVELLKIRHLSLPDNMLGADEAKLIAEMIKLDPPLRTLNLEMNNLDADCAQLIAEALKFNTNLAILNISKNKLADLGVTTLLRPLIKARLTETKEGGLDC